MRRNGSNKNVLSDQERTRISATQKRWYEGNRERARTNTKRWRDTTDKAELAKRKSEYYFANREKWIGYARTRKERVRAARAGADAT